ncbi:hypothetical protein [Methylobacterium aquaticum]|uniref:hypothetical protein n=1 Tax=Methylobacterium aquaticum TaxID=270351 RepID=UPI0018CF046A|nr:hypothetical protein [Methylobacterium aquaticum]
MACLPVSLSIQLRVVFMRAAPVDQASDDWAGDRVFKPMNVIAQKDCLRPAEDRPAERHRYFVDMKDDGLSKRPDMLEHQAVDTSRAVDTKPSGRKTRPRRHFETGAEGRCRRPPA